MQTELLIKLFFFVLARKLDKKAVFWYNENNEKIFTNKEDKAV